MTAVSAAGRPASGITDRSAPGTGFPVPLPFTALDGLRGLAVAFVLAFALRSDIARLHPPAALQYLADGGYVLIPLLFVLVGFLLCRPLTAVLSGSGVGDLAAGLVRRIVPLHLVAWAITVGWLATGTGPGRIWDWLSSAFLLNGVVGRKATGYAVSWSVSVTLWSVVLLAAAALALSFRTGRQPPSTPAQPSPSAEAGRRVTAVAVATG